MPLLSSLNPDLSAGRRSLNEILSYPVCSANSRHALDPDSWDIGLASCSICVFSLETTISLAQAHVANLIPVPSTCVTLSGKACGHLLLQPVARL